ncbi:MAG: HSP90 family protein [Prevotellaceae bacterium]|jgi:molecular chaperone HtpG|nr:HSP90 family protein [Prevotellaceae bacterium]
MTEQNNDKDKAYLFQVNLKGMIELLSEHIYSSPNVFVRELLQNGTDAITAGCGTKPFAGEINVVKEGSTVIFEDSGTGLTEDEIHRFLSVIGQSSKRDTALSRNYIGKFGIGMLSCFVVSNEIVVETCSAAVPGKTLRWRGKADGTYLMEESAAPKDAGTRVILRPKKEWSFLFEKPELKKNILYFGNALPVRINLAEGDKKEALVWRTPAWLDLESTREELLDCGKQIFNIDFLDAFPIQTLTGRIRGAGFVMPHKIQFTGAKEHRIYMKRMFLCEHAGNLLPEWASFVKCVIDTESLQPTASRESLVDNLELKEAKKELNLVFKDYLRDISAENPDLLQNIIDIHHMYIKALAAEDSSLLKMFADHIPFETNKGVLTFGALRLTETEIYYTLSSDDFKRIRRIAGSRGKTVINAIYSFENDIIRKIRIVFPEIRLSEINPRDILDDLGKAVENDAKFSDFERRADEILTKYYCKAQINKFDPEETPVIYFANDEALQNKHIMDFSGEKNPFASALHEVMKKKDVPAPVLCFNKNNQLVNDLVDMDDEIMFEAVVKILYVQSLMLGNYPVQKNEMNMFNDSVYQLLISGVGHSSLFGK